MKRYKITILPTSRFVTSIRGDTLFGQICWSVAMLSGQERLRSLLQGYETSPFLILSDAFARGWLPKPVLPSTLLKEDPEAKKINRKKRWLKAEDLRHGRFANAVTDEEAKFSKKSIMTLHNSLDYRSFRTGGEDAFAPFGTEEIAYHTPLDIYALVSEDFSFEELKSSFELLGNGGYGKKSSSGKGRFEVLEYEEIVWDENSQIFMTLGPMVLEGLDVQCWYEPFTRFGRHGGERAKKMPFKRPIVMADCGAVLRYEAYVEKTFEGKGVRGVSHAYTDTVHQGFAILFPLKEALL